MIPVGNGISLDEYELQWSFVRSSGPGGQNVNKLSTAVQLRFDAARSPSLPDEVRGRLLRLAGKKATAGGEVVIEARRHRSQELNRRDALERLLALIRRASTKPRPRRRTKPTAASRRRRLERKRRRGEIKRRRGPVRGGEE
ncbi:MAG: alternative ribosome rescue aminoacyl-tRNA hydrolase ArfB [Spirochaetota bacterium]